MIKTDTKELNKIIREIKRKHGMINEDEFQEDAGKKGMKWGENNGRANGKRKAGEDEEAGTTEEEEEEETPSVDQNIKKTGGREIWPHIPTEMLGSDNEKIENNSIGAKRGSVIPLGIFRDKMAAEPLSPNDTSISHDPTADIDERIGKRQATEHVLNLLSKRSPKHGEILKELYGFGTGEPKTLEQYSKENGISTNQARKRRDEALRFIRSQKSWMKTLSDFKE